MSVGLILGLCDEDGVGVGSEEGMLVILGLLDGMDEALGEEEGATDGSSWNDIVPPPHQQHASQGLSFSVLVKFASCGRRLSQPDSTLLPKYHEHVCPKPSMKEGSLVQMIVNEDTSNLLQLKLTTQTKAIARLESRLLLLILFDYLS